MSNEALTWAFRQTAPSTGAKFVLVALADGANHEHRCFPGQKKIMAMTGQGARSVVRHLAELESSGLVVRERRNVGYQHRLVDGFRLPVGVVASTPSAKTTPAAMAHAEAASSAQRAVVTPANGDQSQVPSRQDKGTQRTNPTTKSVARVDSAQTIVAAWCDWCTQRPPGRVVGQIAKLVGEMLAEGIDPEFVKRGLAAWTSKGLSPSVLPSVVNEVMNARASPATSTADARFQAGIDLARQLERQELEA